MLGMIRRDNENKTASIVLPFEIRGVELVPKTSDSTQNPEPPTLDSKALQGWNCANGSHFE